MKITCHSCAAKYTVSDDKVQGKTVKMKCRKCGATIVVGGSAGPGEGASDDGGGVDLPAGSYLVNVAEGDQRTMTLAELVDGYNQGVVTADTYVWADGMADWQALSENDAIVAALNQAAGTGPASGAADAWGANGTNGNGGYGGAPDPGAQGGYGAPAAAGYGAPAYAAPAYTAPAAHDSQRPAAARKEAGRKSGDLFGGGGGGSFEAGGYGAGASVATPSNTGKRDENSVLFSLSALTTSGPPSRPAPGGGTTATKEDSGLIDLKALAANATPAPAPGGAVAAAPVIDAVGLFPLGAPVVAPPAYQGGPASIAPMTVAPGKRSPLPLVLGGLVAVAAIVGVFLFVRSAGETKPTATPTAAAPTPTTTAEAVAAAPTATATATADATATAEASSSAVAAGPGPKWKGNPGGKPGPGAKTSTPGGPAPPPGDKPKPPANSCAAKCGSDLHCAMKCSAGKK